MSTCFLLQLLQEQFDSESVHTAAAAAGDAPYTQFSPRHDWLQDEQVEDDDDTLEMPIFEGEPFGPSKALPKPKAPGAFAKKLLKTKHDPEICNRRNADKMMSFPTSMSGVGDLDTYDAKIPNRVFNAMRNFSYKESGRAARVREKADVATSLHIDRLGRLVLFKLVNQGVLGSVSGSISTGKEAVVLHATGGHSDICEMPAECVAKVIKAATVSVEN